MTMKDKIQTLALDIFDQVRGYRQHIHANPELSFKEFETSAYIKSHLEEWGIPYTEMANTGVVGLITGGIPSDKIIALRADMDALPIIEANEKPYVSKNPGVMHACGHDVHSSSLLGTAYILNSMKEEFAGTIKLIFQPGEEVLPGGASIMIKEGVLDNPKPQAILGQHVMPLIDAGKVGFRSGIYMASTDELYVTVHGKGGHGAQPHQNIDPVLIAAHIVVALQQIVSRNADPRLPSVLSFGKVQANGATNIIPNEVKMEGTFRTLNEDWRKDAKKLMKKMAEGIAESMGGSCDFNIMDGYPYLINEPVLSDRARAFAEDYLGKENVLELDIWMAAEDFAYYSQVTDACFYRLGTGNKAKDTCYSVHTPNFDIDEDALKLSTGLMAYIALKQLGN
ncbi:M20 metallopeptidase family protein [Pedobacter gandavensis]|uniref:Amidohydrolase n=1 Tax=Pedobacter gandavensis TaxID=2679963 RepID=A0ABR6F0N5_9SPHI|nr:M20 family metallopeptidase [Pedobacter gandavensis]MBB2151100.1 amidohydrolase [Pedobacter gandavensis]